MDDLIEPQWTQRYTKDGARAAACRRESGDGRYVLSEETEYRSQEDPIACSVPQRPVPAAPGDFGIHASTGGGLQDTDSPQRVRETVAHAESRRTQRTTGEYNHGSPGWLRPDGTVRHFHQPCASISVYLPNSMPANGYKTSFSGAFLPPIEIILRLPVFRSCPDNGASSARRTPEYLPRPPHY